MWSETTTWGVCSLGVTCLHSEVYNYAINQIVDFTRRASRLVAYRRALCYWILTSVYKCTSLNEADDSSGQGNLAEDSARQGNLAEDSARQGNLETTCWCLRPTTGYNGCLMMMMMMMIVERLRPCSHCYSGTVIRHKFVPAQLSRNIGARSHWAKLCRIKI